MNKSAKIALGVIGFASVTSATMVFAKRAEQPVLGFQKELLEAAGTYSKYTRVDDEVRLQSPLCTPPITPPIGLRVSKSSDASTHGNKTYYLYAKDVDTYKKLGVQPIGQTIVKESWEPSKVISVPPTVKNALFIMTKVDPATKGTDNGWIYGTVTADGKTVTSGGRVQSCMGCHTGSTTHDRMFGLTSLPQ